MTGTGQQALRRRWTAALDDLLATRESGPAAARIPELEPLQAPGAQRKAAKEQRSLFSEVLDWMFAPLLLLWPLSIAFTLLVARSLADAPFDRALTDHVNVLTKQLRFEQGLPSVQGQSQLRDLIGAGAGANDTLFLQIETSDGRLLAGESQLPRPALYDFPAPGRTKLRPESFRGQDVRIAYTHVQSPSDDSGQPGVSVLVQVAETLDARNTLANEIIKGVIFPQFLFLPLAVGLIWFGLGRGLVPLKDLQQRIRSRRTHDLSPIDTRDTPEELAPLIESFNDLLGRLDATLGAQRRFIADAAHQLKTPLAGLRTQAELAVRETDPAELNRRLRQLAISSQRSAHLVSQLLALAKMENTQQEQTVQLDLSELLRQIAIEWVTPAIQKGIDFGLEAEDSGVWIVGQPLMLQEMISNLIDNALRYTPTGGKVTARLTQNQQQALLEIEDSGRGIPVAERELVFDRFYRVLGTDIDGSGLGLAIVREIAMQHHATVSISDADGPSGARGTRFTVKFPRADRPLSDSAPNELPMPQ